MRALKFVAPLGLALACVGGVADAANTNIITLQNRDAKPVSVEIRVGEVNPGGGGAGCGAFALGKVFVIAPTSTEKIQITAERWACLRLVPPSAPPGGAWRVEPLRGGADYSFYVN